MASLNFQRIGKLSRLKMQLADYQRYPLQINALQLKNIPIL
jgi:hypothetical protein